MISRSLPFLRLAWSLWIGVAATVCVPSVCATTASEPSLEASGGGLRILEQVSDSAVRRGADSLSQADAHQSRRSIVRCQRHSVRSAMDSSSTELNNRAHAAGVKVCSCWAATLLGSRPAARCRRWSTMLRPSNRQYAYDGVDVDWEYPETTGDRRFLVELMAKLRGSNPDYVLVDRRGSVGWLWIRPEAPAALSRLRQHYDVRLRRARGPRTGSSIHRSSGTGTTPHPGNVSRAEACMTRRIIF